MMSNWLRCQIDSGVKLTPVSNWLRCQIDSDVKLTPVSNWCWCQIDSFTLLVSNCPPNTLGVKLTPVSNWCRCQIVLQPQVSDRVLYPISNRISVTLRPLVRQGCDQWVVEGLCQNFGYKYIWTLVCINFLWMSHCHTLKIDADSDCYKCLQIQNKNQRNTRVESKT